MHEILKEFLNLLSKISINHQRNSDFIKEKERILMFLKNDIISKLSSNASLFNIFQKNKRVLLFLFKNNFLKIDEYVYNRLISNFDYIEYFKPELLLYSTKQSITDEIFEEAREKGENYSYLCELIRNDSIVEFITFINKENLSLQNAKIEFTCFETNQFLVENKSVSIVEYAMFFG